MPEETDREHLRLLSIFHYVVGGLCGLFACVFILHIVIGILALTDPHGFADNGGPPRFVGLIFLVVGSFALLLGWTAAALIIAAGRCLAKRRHYAFCFVVAAISCAFMPFGTVLGVFTIVVLTRDSVKVLFGRPVPASQATPQPGTQPAPPPPPGS